MSLESDSSFSNGNVPVNRSYTFAEIQSQIKQGRDLLIFNSKVYDVSKWLGKHPGGELLIKHMLGRDATDQILTFHYPIRKIDKYLKLCYIGDIEAQDKNINRPLSVAFRHLHKTIQDQGLFKSSAAFYLMHSGLILVLLAFSILTLLSQFGNSLAGITVSGIGVALAWHQAAGFMHEGGHNLVTQNPKIDLLIGLLFSNLITGISIGWWKRYHFVHHLMANDPFHDPDIQYLPLLAISRYSFEPIYSSFYKTTFLYNKLARIFVPMQHIIYLPMVLMARPLLLVKSIIYLVRNRASLFWKLEIAGIVGFWFFFLWMISVIQHPIYRVYFVLLVIFGVGSIHLQFFVGHNAMSADPLGADEDFVSHQLRTTMDYTCNEWMDGFNGGLQFHTAHHLFPRIPCHNLRRANELILKFIKDQNLEYTNYSFSEANVVVFRHLKQIAKEANEK